ncbi:MAG: site-specific DNA-methyltransferase [Acidobacteria bacterium]|nr:site-specific DNA-methyltransferase [Acidobacteriota bacterium]
MQARRPRATSAGSAWGSSWDSRPASSWAPPRPGEPGTRVFRDPARRPGVEYPPVHRVYFGDNLPILRALPAGSADLIYIDPPFNTGKVQERTRIRTRRAERGDRTGFQGRRYETVRIGTARFADRFDDYPAFLEPRLREAHRVLAGNGTLYVHLDCREVHYLKVLLDAIFGRECFLNEIIWAYDYGGKTTKKWPPKHDNILVYVKRPGDYVFNVEEIERIPYMAPGLVDSQKAARGKLPTDTWWHTIVPTNSPERTGFPTQKPLGILKRIVLASSHPDDLVLDFFAGSGTTGEAAYRLGRRFLLVDNHPQAIAVMRRRFARLPGVEFLDWRPGPATRRWRKDARRIPSPQARD